MISRIGVDISGGDYAPWAALKGAHGAQKEIGHRIILIGPEAEIIAEAKRERIPLDNFEIIDAPEKIEMDEQAARSIRRKKNSSIVMGCELLRDKKIEAFVSCGNTGAVVAAGTLILGLIEGVERPGISIPIPTKNGVALVIDVGANINPKPLHLLQYGVMASVYYSLVFGKPHPTLGLLNIGEEETKGTDFVQTVHKLFSASRLNFFGNCEAKDIFSGRYHCVVCDGFVGNVALKVSEAVAELTREFLKDAIRSDFFGRLGFLFVRRSLKKLKRAVDYAEYGGAPLLGVNGVVIIGHGRSSPYAIKNAIKVAAEEVERNLVGNIKEKINEVCKDSGVGEVLAT